MKLLFIYLAAICFVCVNGHIYKNLFQYYMSHANVTNASAVPADTPGSNTIVTTIICAEQNKVPENTVRTMMQKKTFLSSEEIKDFASCIAKGYGLMNEDGSWSKTFLEDSEHVDKCKHLGGKDQNEIASKMFECILVNGN